MAVPRTNFLDEVSSHFEVMRRFRGRSSCDIDLVVEELRGLDLEAKGRDGITALSEFSESASDWRFQALLLAGADPKSALLPVLHCNRADSYALLAAHGLRVRVEDIFNSRPDSDLNLLDRVVMLRTALEFGALSGSEHFEGKPLAHLLCALAERFDFGLTFAGMFGDLDARDSNGETAAVLAARTGKKAALRILCLSGADLSLRNNDGENVFSFPRRSAELLRGLVKRGRHPKEAIALVKAGVSPRDAQNWEPDLIHQSVSPNCPQVLDFLVARGADLSIEDNEGLTPLQYCAKLDWGSSVLQLIRLGADVNAVNRRGTAFSAALDKPIPSLFRGLGSLMGPPCLSACAIALLVHGADPLARDEAGNLYVADSMGTDEAEITKRVAPYTRFADMRGSTVKPTREPPVKRRRGNQEKA